MGLPRFARRAEDSFINEKVAFWDVILIPFAVFYDSIEETGVFEGFHNFFQNQDLYRGLDESIRDGITANQPQ